jgi:thioredoxin-related protein
MKKLTIIAAAIACIGTFGSFTTFTKASATAKQGQQADVVHWYTWEQAAVLQTQHKRKIFVDVYTEWCGWCKHMDKTTFTDPAVVKMLNEQYYAVKLDAEQKTDIVFQNTVFKYVKTGNTGYNELATSLLKEKMSFPTTVFLDEDYKLIQVLPGFLEPKVFKTIAKYFGEDFYKNTAWEEFQKTNG